MFEVNDESYDITLSKGDTGAIQFTVSGYTFGENDRAQFTVRNSRGSIVKQVVCALVNNACTVTFLNADTDTLPAGTYSWDVRYVINPYYDESGALVDGDQVLTPRRPMRLIIVDTVGVI